MLGPFPARSSSVACEGNKWHCSDDILEPLLYLLIIFNFPLRAAELKEMEEKGEWSGEAHAHQSKMLNESINVIR